jgi:hypothetical protein
MKKITDYYCKGCNKYYSCRQNLYAHNKRFHTNSFPTFSSKSTQINAKTALNNAKTALNNAQMGESATQRNDKYKYKYHCEYCDKYFTRIDIVTRHQKKCKIKFGKIKELTKENISLKKEIELMKKNTLDMMNKQCKMHPKTFQKIQKNTINNNSNNININITQNIIPLGDEDIMNVMSKEEQHAILKYRIKSIFELTRRMHCGDKYPQFNNCVITCLKSPFAYTYNDEKKSFIAVDKNKLLNEIYECRKSDIEDMLETHHEELDNTTMDKIQLLFDTLESNPKYENECIGEVNLMIYNEKKLKQLVSK